MVIPLDRYSPSIARPHRKSASSRDSRLKLAASTGEPGQGDVGYNLGLQSPRQQPFGVERQSESPQRLTHGSQTDDSDFSVGSMVRGEDARQMLGESDIARPQKRMSGTDSSDGELRRLSGGRPYQLCHSCKLRVTSDRICSNCGHESCEKCTEDVGTDFSQVINSRDVRERLPKPETRRTIKPSDIRNPRQTVATYDSQRPERQKPNLVKSPRTPLPTQQDDGDSKDSLIRNNPFILADQKTQATTANPIKTSASTPHKVRSPSASTRLSYECVDDSCFGLRDASCPNQHSKCRRNSRRASQEFATPVNVVEGYISDEVDISVTSSPEVEGAKQRYQLAPERRQSLNSMSHLTVKPEEIEPEKKLSPPLSQTNMSTVMGSRILDVNIHNPHPQSTNDNHNETLLQPHEKLEQTVLPSWMDRPSKVPEAVKITAVGSEGKSLAPLEASVAERWDHALYSDVINVPTTAPSQEQKSPKKLSTSMPRIPSPSMNTPSKPYQANLESKIEAWPVLRVVKRTSKQQLQETDTVPWTRQSLRKITPPTLPHNVHRPITKETSEGLNWRDELNKVGRAEKSKFIEAPSHSTLLRSESLGRELPMLSKASSLYHTTSEHGQRPQSIITHGKANGQTHDISQGNYGKSRDEEEFVLRVGNLELPATTESANDHLSGSTAGYHTPSVLELPIELPSKDDHNNPEIHRPEAYLPPDHTCEWRTRYMDLSSEVDLLRLEIDRPQSSNSADRHATIVDSVAQTNAGVGGALVGDDFGIEGLTIVLHLKGKEDLIIETNLKTDGSP